MERTVRRWMLISLVILLMPCWASAITYYVSKSGSDSNTCTTAQNPGGSAKLTIAAGATCMSGGDTLLIQAGTYDEAMQGLPRDTFPWRNGSPGAYTRYARYQNDSVRIRPSSVPDGNVVYVNYNNSSYIELDGLILDGTNAARGVIGIDGQAGDNNGTHHIRIKNCEIGPTPADPDGGLGGIDPGNGLFANDSEWLNNRVYGSAWYGVYLPGKRNILDGNLFEGHGGYAIHLYSDFGGVDDNIIRNNTIRNSGFNVPGCHGGCTHNAMVIGSGSGNQSYNNVIYSNAGGLQVYSSAINHKVYNNTIYNNTGACVYIGEGASGTDVRNNICYQNTEAISNNGSGTTQSNNLTSNPLFANPAGNDFHLQSGSPAINAGIDLSTTFSTDIEGTTRPVDGIWDIGAYEYGGSNPPPQPIGLVAWYTFDENTGTTAADSSGQGHTGTLNTAGWGIPIIGTSSVSLDGTRYVEVTGTAALRPLSVFGLSAWIKMSTTDTGGCTVASMGDSYGLMIRPTGAVLMFYYTGVDWVILEASGLNVLTNTAGHLAATKDATGLRLWWNKAQVAFLATTGTINYTLAANLQIGRHGNGQTTLDCVGLIDQVRIYDQALNQEGVTNLYEEGVPMPGVASSHCIYTVANAAEGQYLGSVNTDRPHLLFQPIGLRCNVKLAGTGITEYFPPSCRKLPNGPWTALSNSIQTIGARIAPDSAVNMGDSTTVPLGGADPIASGGFTPVAGRFVADTINTAHTTTLANGQYTVWEARISFESPWQGGDQVQCRFQRQDGSAFNDYGSSTRTLTLTSPPPPSGPIVINGQNGTVITGLKITNPNGSCVQITNSTNITIKESEIGPCGGTTAYGIDVNNSSQVHIYDNYIHVETQATDYEQHNDIYVHNGSHDIDIQGNVLAFGQANVSVNSDDTNVAVYNVTVTGNYSLNPRGRTTWGGNHVALYGDSTGANNNYAITISQNYFATISGQTYNDLTEDFVNIAYSTGTVVDNNYFRGTGGNLSVTGCTQLTEHGSVNTTFSNNKVDQGGNCGVNLAGGLSHTVTGLIMVSTNFVDSGACGIKVQDLSGDCDGVHTISNNQVAWRNSASTYEFNYVNNGGCGTVNLSGNNFDGPAVYTLYNPMSSTNPPPLIPPLPKNCVVESPYTTQTSMAACHPAQAILAGGTRHGGTMR